MPPGRDRWLRLSPLLDEALALDDAGRAAWLETLRASDPALAEELTGLLERHGRLQSEGFLEGTASPPPADSALAGLVVGAWTLRSRLGQGGMGSVWLADRSDGRFSGKAAVKLLNANLIGRDGEGRFRREGSILARLNHPHIARMLDAGLSPLGQPFIVLDYVDGEPIDRYCESRRLDLPARLGIFLQVLEAVAHAHSNLIVHRDLKPGNVLVDRDGRPRLLDFGIAKLIEPDPDGPANVTREGESALTLEYAAPEQVSGGHVTTATDIYSLGVLLSVLLTGRHPAGSVPRTPADWIRAIVEIEPPALSSLAGGPSATKLRAALRGDLDNIVARALKKKPAERYPSVEVFADDLRRHLRHEPVSARPDTWAYRMAKLARRHPVALTAAGAGLLATVIFTAGIAWQAREARRQRDEARAQMARATAAREFMGFLLSVASPPGSKLSSGDLLQQGEDLIDREYADNDPLRAEMLVAVGKQHLGSERYEKATPILERAAELAERSGDPALQARALCPLAMLRAAHGEFDQAEALMKRALEGLPDDSLHDLLRAECLIDRGSFSYFSSDAEAMKRDAAAALALIDGSPIPAIARRIEALAVKAYGHFLARESSEADTLYAEVMAGLERSGRDRTLLAADTCNNWSLVHYQGNISKAEPLSRRAVELRRSIEGADAIAPSVTFNHAGVLLQLARYAEAEPLFEETIRTARARKEQLIERDAMLELVDLYIETGDLERAASQIKIMEPLLKDGLLGAFREIHLAYFKGRHALALGDAAAARDLLTPVVEGFEKRKARISLFVFTLNALARAQLALGDAAAATATAARAVEMATSMAHKDSPSYLVGLSTAVLADARLASGDREGARGAFIAALEQLRVTLGEEHPATVAVLKTLPSL